MIRHSYHHYDYKTFKAHIFGNVFFLVRASVGTKTGAELIKAINNKTITAPKIIKLRSSSSRQRTGERKLKQIQQKENNHKSQERDSVLASKAQRQFKF